ncbi:MAG: hypothetical protein EOP44_03390 [Sphingobacteriaceae bacterium]|nr:MAG: hypothetical protein EOP44_03390 [Sphingobacteriaceae bacterium]
MEDPVVFIPSKNYPTFLQIWKPFLFLSLFNFAISFPVPYGIIIFCIVETLLLIGQLFTRFGTKIIILIREKTFQFHYVNCFQKKFLITIDIPAAAGSFQLTKISKYSSEYQWQLIIFNDRKYQAKISERKFDQSQLEEMVRIINLINKDRIESIVF